MGWTYSKRDMEPLTTAAIAVGTIIATKALEKTTEKVTDTFLDKTGKFLVTLKKQSPHTVAAIEKAPEQPLDYGKAVLEVESAAQANLEVAQAAQELAAAAKVEPNSNFIQSIQQLADTLKSQPQHSSVINNQKLADEIKNVFQGNTFNAPVTFT
jgi:MinD-like ATPase involved in chromosome partitioning or flagellar assembly